MLTKSSLTSSPRSEGCHRYSCVSASSREAEGGTARWAIAPVSICQCLFSLLCCTLRGGRACLRLCPCHLAPSWHIASAQQTFVWFAWIITCFLQVPYIVNEIFRITVTLVNGNCYSYHETDKIRPRAVSLFPSLENGGNNAPLRGLIKWGSVWGVLCSVPAMSTQTGQTFSTLRHRLTAATFICLKRFKLHLILLVFLWDRLRPCNVPGAFSLGHGRDH